MKCFSREIFQVRYALSCRLAHRYDWTGQPSADIFDIMIDGNKKVSIGSRRCTDERKIEAGKQVTGLSHPVAGVAPRLGITLYRR
jgi:hypothetical protein